MNLEVLNLRADISTNFYKQKKGGELMKILFILLLLLALVGCAHSNFAWHRPALYFHDSEALVDQNSQEYLAEQNRQYETYPRLYPYTYSILEW